jgi:hypothetical protein
MYRVHFDRVDFLTGGGGGGGQNTGANLIPPLTPLKNYSYLTVSHVYTSFILFEYQYFGKNFTLST